MDSVNNAKNDDEAFTNLIKSDTGDDNDNKFEDDFLNWLLDGQAFADDAVESEEDDNWDNLFDADVKGMSADDFDNEDKFNRELDANVADAFSDEVEAMNTDVTQASPDDDHFAHVFDKEIEEMSLDDENSQFDMTNTMSDDSESDDFLKVMKAVDGKDTINDDFEDFVDFVQSNDVDDAGTDDNFLEMEEDDGDDDNDDFVKSMSEVGDTDDDTDDDFDEFLDEMESSEIKDDTDEDDADFDKLLSFAQKLTHTDEDTNPMKSEGGNLPATESDHEDNNLQPTVSTSGKMRRIFWRLRRRGRKARRRRRRRMRRRMRRRGIRWRGRQRGRRIWRPLRRNRYYRKYRSTLKKYYRLRKKYYSLKSKYKKVKRACKKTTFKLVADYCKKVHKKMNDYKKVYSKTRGCRNRRKCKFYEKTTNTTRNYYNFMYKIRPTAAMCNRLIQQTKG